MIEIRDVEPGEVLMEGRISGRNLADAFEGADVVLAAGLQPNVSEIGGGRKDDSEDVPEATQFSASVGRLTQAS